MLGEDKLIEHMRDSGGSEHSTVDSSRMDSDLPSVCLESSSNEKAAESMEDELILGMMEF